MAALVDVAAELAAAVRVLSRHRLDAIILLDPAAAVEGGVVLDARTSRELLVSIFLEESLNHLQGAAVLRGSRIERAGVSISWMIVVERADELAAGVAIAIDEATGEVRTVDRTGHVEVVEVDTLEAVLNEHTVRRR